MGSLVLQNPGIGENMVLLPMLKTKECADPVGHFQLSDQWKEPISLKARNWSVFPPSNWSNVTPKEKTKDAMVDFQTVLLTMLQEQEWRQTQTTHITDFSVLG